MMPWKYLRFGLLGITALMIGAATLILFLNPMTGIPVPTPYSFPKTLDLAGASSATPPLGIVGPPFVIAMAEGFYRYQPGSTPITITMDYIIDSTGDVKAYTFGTRTRTFLNQGEIRIGTMGQYLLYTEAGHAHLTACINPRGQDTVTLTDFEQNRKSLDLTPPRLVAWLFNLEPFYDRRCLWSHLSISLQSTPEVAYTQLESAWVPWSTWWRAHFPTP